MLNSPRVDSLSTFIPCSYIGVQEGDISPPNLPQLEPSVAISSMSASFAIHFGVPLSETGLGLLVTDKGKEISFHFSSGPSSPVGYAILDKYVVPLLATSGDPPVFCPDWGIHVNNRVMHSSVTIKMREKLPLPRNAIGAS